MEVYNNRVALSYRLFQVITLNSEFQKIREPGLGYSYV